MIDKLDVRVPRKTQFTPEFQEVYRHASDKGILRPSNYYAMTGDFRSYGYQIRLHMFARFGRKQNGKGAHDHKLELYDTAEMKFDEMLAEISRVFICEPLDLEMLRRDVCVDVEGISLDWFKTHTRVEFKRNIRDIGYMIVHTRKGETFYLGVKPNQFRFTTRLPSASTNTNGCCASRKSRVFRFVLSNKSLDTRRAPSSHALRDSMAEASVAARCDLF